MVTAIDLGAIYEMLRDKIKGHFDAVELAPAAIRLQPAA